jgi:hypothetical protein
LFIANYFIRRLYPNTSVIGGKHDIHFFIGDFSEAWLSGLCSNQLL